MCEDRFHWLLRRKERDGVWVHDRRWFHPDKVDTVKCESQKERV